MLAIAKFKRSLSGNHVVFPSGTLLVMDLHPTRNSAEIHEWFNIVSTDLF